MLLLNEEEQRLALEYTLSDAKLFSTVYGVLKPQYFDEPLNRVVEFVLDYYTQHNAIANFDILTAKFGMPFTRRETKDDEIEYTINTMEGHCKLAAVKLTFEECITDFEKGNIDAIAQKFEQANSISIHRSLGINQFENVKQRLENMQKHIDTRMIGMPRLDAMIEGIRRGEMLLVTAGTAGGKSVFLANISHCLTLQGLHGVYVSLELNEDSVAKRLDSILTGIESRAIFDNIDKVVESLAEYQKTSGSLITKKLRGNSNANAVRSYVMEYKLQMGRYPDFCVVDYLDLLHPIEKGIQGAFDRDKAISEELRDVFDQYNMYGFTASQLNRGAVELSMGGIPNHSHIAGGLSKLNTCDAAIAIIAPSEEEVDTGERMVHQLKIRNGERHPAPFTMYLNPKNLRLTDTPSIVTTPGAQHTMQDTGKISSIKERLRMSVTDSEKKDVTSS